jgi:hypothetical protein
MVDEIHHFLLLLGRHLLAIQVRRQSTQFSFFLILVAVTSHRLFIRIALLNSVENVRTLRFEDVPYLIF